jgi:hypothetical protein
LSELIDEVLGIRKIMPAIDPAPVEVVEPSKAKKPIQPAQESGDILSNLTKVVDDLLKPIRLQLDEIGKRTSQPVQFRTSEPATGSSSAAKQGQEKPPGPAGQ